MRRHRCRPGEPRCWRPSGNCKPPKREGARDHARAPGREAGDEPRREGLISQKSLRAQLAADLTRVPLCPRLVVPLCGKRESMEKGGTLLWPRPPKLGIPSPLDLEPRRLLRWRSSRVPARAAAAGRRTRASSGRAIERKRRLRREYPQVWIPRCSGGEKRSGEETRRSSWSSSARRRTSRRRPRSGGGGPRTRRRRRRSIESVWSTRRRSGPPGSRAPSRWTTRTTTRTTD
mmetsp:Transcript_45208/g.129674  ORF Transcript_45208/g.129674 Transcript_45208/m.129674 type:complete len:232 (+) Transcript_45208:164-859(+)